MRIQAELRRSCLYALGRTLIQGRMHSDPPRSPAIRREHDYESSSFNVHGHFFGIKERSISISLAT